MPFLRWGAILDRTHLHRTNILFLLIALASFYLRWPIAGHDVEHYIGPDEGEVIENVLEMLKTGDLDHRHPGYPGLHFYLQMVPASVHRIAASVRGEGDSIAALPRSGFYLMGRRVTLVAGWLAATVVFFVGRRWFTAWGGVVSGALVVFSPLVFQESRFVNPDLMLMFFVSISLGLSLSLIEDRSWRAFLLSGASLGLTTAIKYTGALVVVPFLLAWLAGPDYRSQVGKWFGGLLMAAVSFVVVSPYTVLNLPAFFRGLTMHIGYYSAADVNTTLELSRLLLTSGLGPVAGTAAVITALWAVFSVDRRVLVVFSFPLAYLFLFAVFNRAFPRHALPLLPSMALLAGYGVVRGADWLTARKPMLSVGLVRVLTMFLVLNTPVLGSYALALAVSRPSPAARAADWVQREIPKGSRILEDQYTPQLDQNRYRIHRLRVEEKVFVGNFDWVLRSGYPPGLPIEGLPVSARFEQDGALGAGILVYRVPDRESLMEISFSGKERTIQLRAGELNPFGQGWHSPAAGVIETSRLSRGKMSEVFFVLPYHPPPVELAASLWAAGISPDSEVRVSVQLNNKDFDQLRLQGDKPKQHRFILNLESLQAGLNRIVFRYDTTMRRDRRHLETAMCFYRLEITKDGSKRE